MLIRNTADVQSDLYSTQHEKDGSLVEDVCSGVEILSTPQKQKSVDKEHPIDIEGIGCVSSAWIGKTGKQELFESLGAEIERYESSRLSRELHTLARTCKSAFECLQASSSQNSCVKQAVSLCETYCTPKPMLSFNQRIHRLWKSGDPSVSSENGSVSEIVGTVLGENLVHAITEKHKQPPDVSMICVCEEKFMVLRWQVTVRINCITDIHSPVEIEWEIAMWVCPYVQDPKLKHTEVWGSPERSLAASS